MYGRIFSNWSFDACAPTVVQGSERVTDHHLLHAFDGASHELTKDLFLYERARRARADLALVQRENREAFHGLVREVIVLENTSSKNTFGDLPPSSNVTLMMFSDAYCLMRRPVVVLPVNAILRMRLLDARGLPASMPKPSMMFRTPGGSRLPMRSTNIIIDAGVCSAASAPRISGGERRRKLNDLADDVASIASSSHARKHAIAMASSRSLARSLARSLEVEDFLEALVTTPPGAAVVTDGPRQQALRTMAEAAVARARGNMSEAARALSVARSTLYRTLRSPRARDGPPFVLKMAP